MKNRTQVETMDTSTNWHSLAQRSRSGFKFMRRGARTINQVKPLRVIRVRGGREETGREGGREDCDTEDRTKYRIN